MAVADLTTVLGFLAELEANNNREWYSTHKEERLAAEAEFLDLVASLQQGVASFVPGIQEHQAKSLTFKLQRDTRFSADKSPYNPCFRAHLGPTGKPFIPMGPYIAICPGDKSLLGGGMFASMFSDATRMVRDAILADPDRWLRISDALPWPVRGESLKNTPRGYPQDHPCSEHLKHKSWYTEIPVSDTELTTAGFVRQAIADFATMHPLNEFLNHALSQFKCPNARK